MVGDDPNLAALAGQPQDQFPAISVTPSLTSLCQPRAKRVALIVEAPDFKPERICSKQRLRHSPAGTLDCFGEDGLGDRLPLSGFGASAFQHTAGEGAIAAGAGERLHARRGDRRKSRPPPAKRHLRALRLEEALLRRLATSMRSPSTRT